MAGTIQGRLDGDLGDLGAASLSERHVTELLDFVVLKTEKILNVEANGTASEHRSRRHKAAASTSFWRPLDLRQQLHLELAARLLACGQRLYVARVGWDAIENPDEYLRSFLKRPGSDKDEEWLYQDRPAEPALLPEMLVHSPYMSLVLRPLLSESGTISRTQAEDTFSGDKDDRGNEMDESLLSALQLLQGGKASQDSAVAYLAIVGACAECFPTGACWTSNATTNWYRLLPRDKSKEDVIRCQGSSPCDLGVLLLALGNLLEAYGRPEGDPLVQYWIVLTLTKLTEATAVLFQNTGKKSRTLRPVNMAWRRIWYTLFRKDLRYVSYANGSMEENSTGEIVLVLLTEIVRKRCTETLLLENGSTGGKQASFVQENQPEIWNLEVFKPSVTGSIVSNAPYELVLALIRHSGLSDLGVDDHVSDEMERHGINGEQFGGWSLRDRLVRLVVSQLEGALDRRTKSAKQRVCEDAHLGKLARCLVGLFNGYVTSMMDYSAKDARFLLSTFDSIFSKFDRYPSPEAQNIESESGFGFCMALLWASKQFGSNEFKSQLSNSCEYHLDLPRVVAGRLQRRLNEEDARTKTRVPYFVSDSDSDRLRKDFTLFVAKWSFPFNKDVRTERISSPTFENDESTGDMVESQSRPISLSLRTGTIKVLLSAFVTTSQGSPAAASDLLKTIPDVVSFFGSCLSQLARDTYDRDDYFLVASDLQKIALALVELYIRLPSTVNLKHITSSIGLCQSVLKRYEESESGAESTSAEPSTRIQLGSSQHWSDDDGTNANESPEESSYSQKDDYDASAGGKKRAILSYSDTNCKRRRTVSPFLPPPDLRCAQEIGSILLTLDPSASNCYLVCESLLGTELNLEPDSIQGDIDLRSASACVQFLSLDTVILNRLAREKVLNIFETNDHSMVVVICRTIDLIRACANSSSPLYLFGNQECCKVAVTVFRSELILPEDDATLLIDVLNDKDGMYNRARLRGDRLRAATTTFENGSGLFHQLFDKHFVKSFVKLGFDDTSFLVRRLACVAAGAASRFLDEDKVLNGVRDQTAPVAEKVDDYLNWYSTSAFADERSTTSDTVARDSMEVMESDSIFAISHIGGSTRNTKILHNIILDIVEIASSRPGLEFMCFRALENIAYVRGFSDAQDMIDLKSEALLIVWLERQNDHKFKANHKTFPLLLTAPVSLQRVMIYGQYKYLYQDQFSSQTSDASVDFREDCITNYVARYRRLLVPLLLLKTHSGIVNVETSSGVAASLSKVPRFAGILTMLTGECSEFESIIVKLLKMYTVEIQAICSLLLHSDQPDKEMTGQSVQRILSAAVSPAFVEARMSKYLATMVRRMLDLLGKSERLATVVPSTEVPYSSAISKLINERSESRQNNGDDFLELGTSLTELLIFASNELGKSRLREYQLNAWSRFSLLRHFLSGQIQRGGGDQIQLGFFLHVLTDIVLKDSLKTIRPRALRLVKEILSECRSLDKETLKVEVTPVLERLLAVCFYLHESCQRCLLECSRLELKRSEIVLRRSCGFHLRADGGSWGWDLAPTEPSSEAFPKQVVKAITTRGTEADCLLGTFDVILLIIENRRLFRVDLCTFSSVSSLFEFSNFEIGILAEFDERFAAQRLTQGLVGDEDAGDRSLARYASVLRKRVLKSYLWATQPDLGEEVPGSDFGSSIESTLNIDQRLLYAELRELQAFFSTVDEEELVTQNRDGDIKMLCDDLCFICCSNCSKLLRFAASQCMALLSPTQIMNISDMPSRKKLPSGGFNMDLRTYTKAKCIECLADCLKSSEAKVATAAVSTLKILLSTRVGAKASNMVDHFTKSLIAPFAMKEHYCRNGATELTRDEVKSLKKVARHEPDCLDDLKNWCWGKELWIIRDGELFEEWICNVTPSLILCCFEIPAEAKGREQDFQTHQFFGECQRVARLDHRFASTVFPALVLDFFYLSEHSGCKENHSFEGVNEKLTGSFEVLLRSCNGPQHSSSSIKNSARKKATSLIVDTLDALRKVSQKNFLLLKHPQNVLRSSKEKAKAKHSGIERKSGYNEGFSAPTPWKGLAFGVVLHLDGLLVAEACMTVQRYASALFFIDLYLNARFGMAGGLFEDLSSRMSCQEVVGSFKSTTEISGLRHFSESSEMTEEALKASAIKVMSMAAQCYKELHEPDLMFATRMQLSSLNFLDGTIKGTINCELDDLQLAGRTSLDELQALSGQSSSPCSSNRLPVSIAETMQELGLHGLVTRYIEGVLSDNGELRERIHARELREKWFENNLDVQNWNKLLEKATRPETLVTDNAKRFAALPSLGRSFRGFFESIFEALNSFSQNDTNGSLVLLDEARLSALDSIADFGGEKPSAAQLISLVDKLRALKDVDHLVAGNLSLVSTFDFKEIDFLGVARGIRETVLVASATRNPQLPSTFDTLKDHLWKTCTSALDKGVPYMAELSLNRLHSLRNVENVDTNKRSLLSDDLLRTRLEEARILECRGDFNGAIHRMKQLIGFLLRENDLDGPLKCLVTDAQLLCGSWMTRYKTQQARVVLESFMHPGADRARLIFEDDKSTRNADRATQGAMQLGHIVATLYDDLSSRVSSSDWNEAGFRIRSQEDQLEGSTKLLKQLKSTLRAGTKKEKDETQRQIEELTAYCVRTEKEICEIKNERSNIERLIPVYLKLGLESFMSALKTAGPAEHADLSSHIFRMVSLWFSSQQNGLANCNEVNDLMFEQLSRIPSFRFVPLTNQLFARIESYERMDYRHFQDALQCLIFRMCNEHPYHCLIPIIALANGKSVGAGLGRGEASTFLENIGNSKVEAASKVIDRLKSEGFSYTQGLVESYADLSSAYIDLADAPTKHLIKGNKTKNILFSQALNRSQNPLDRCLKGRMFVPCVITSPPVLRPGRDYGDGVDDPIGGETIAGFEPHFSITDSGTLRTLWFMSQIVFNCALTQAVAQKGYIDRRLSCAWVHEEADFVRL